MKFAFLTSIFLATLTFAAAEIQTLQSFGDRRFFRHTRKTTATIGNPNAKPTGKDLGQLTVNHWDWNLCGGDGDGPKFFAFSDPDCPEQVDVPRKWVFFPGGIDESSERGPCAVSKKDFILIPVINRICWEDDVESNCEDLSIEDCLQQTIDNCNEGFEGTEATKATVDGKDAKVVLLRGSVKSFESNCPDDLATVGVESLQAAPAATVGLWVVIPPLSEGEHSIELAGSNNAGFELDFMINLDAE